MSARKSFSRILLALGLAAGLSAGALAAGGHAHQDHAGAALEMQLDNGRKWQTDAPLRQGMSEIRALIGASLPRVHDGRFAPSDFAALADRVQEQVDYVASNCKLPEEADLQLHVALARLLDGVAAMKGDADREQGVLAVVEALNAYGEHFDHAGWVPLGH